MAVHNRFSILASNKGRRGLKNSKGASLVEFAIALPILLLLTAGTAEIGKKFSNATWVQETSYQAALTGGDYPQYIGETKMQNRFTQLYNLQQGSFQGRDSQSSYDDANRTVSFGFSGEVSRIALTPSLSALLNFDLSRVLGARYVGSHLMQNSDAILPDLTRPQNDRNCFYDCGSSTCSQTRRTTSCGDETATVPPPLGIDYGYNPAGGSKNPILGG